MRGRTEISGPGEKSRNVSRLPNEEKNGRVWQEVEKELRGDREKKSFWSNRWES